MNRAHLPYNHANVWLRKAADSGDALAQFNLAMRYAQGAGVPRDSQLAAMWMKRSAEQGCADAQLDLARMFYKGEGVQQNDQLAYFWVLLAGASLQAVARTHAEIENRLSVDQRAVVQAEAQNWRPKIKLTEDQFGV